MVEPSSSVWAALCFLRAQWCKQPSSADLHQQPSPDSSSHRAWRAANPQIPSLLSRSSVCCFTPGTPRAQGMILEVSPTCCCLPVLTLPFCPHICSQPLCLAQPCFHTHPSSQNRCPGSSNGTGSWWEDLPFHNHLRPGFLGLSHACQEHLTLPGRRCRSSLH